MEFNVLAKGSATVFVQPTQGGALEGCTRCDKSADCRATASARGWKQGCKNDGSQVMHLIPTLDYRQGSILQSAG